MMLRKIGPYVFYDNKNSGPAILLVHGNSQSKDTFNSLFKSSLATTCRLVALDLPGHGESPRYEHKSDYSLRKISSLILDFICDLDLQDVVLAGHSLGGHLCIRVASQSPRIKGLAIWGTPPLYGVESLPIAFCSDNSTTFFYQGKMTPKESEELIRTCYPKNDDYLKLIIKDISRTDPQFRTGLLHNILDGDVINEIEIIQSLEFPVLMLIGKNDNLICNDYIKKLVHSGSIDPQIFFLPDVGHFIHLESTEIFVKILNDYIHTLFNSEERVCAGDN